MSSIIPERASIDVAEAVWGGWCMGDRSMSGRGAEEAFFGLRMSDALGQALLRIVESAYPDEGCGLAFAGVDDERVVRVVGIENIQAVLHAYDPANHARARHAFTFAPEEHLRVLLQADQDGLEPRIVFHSHCDASAYLSLADREGALMGRELRIPNSIQLVISVVEGKAVDAAAYAYRSKSCVFVERRLSGWVARFRGGLGP